MKESECWGACRSVHRGTSSFAADSLHGGGLQVKTVTKHSGAVATPRGSPRRGPSAPAPMPSFLPSLSAARTTCTSAKSS